MTEVIGKEKCFITLEEIQEFVNENINKENVFDLFVELLESKKDSKSIFIKVEGDKYDCSISGDFAKGLGLLQDSFYHFCAQALYDSDNIKLLGKDKQLYTLQFKIRPGCTENEADWLGPLKNIAGKLANKMTSRQIFILCLCALLSFGSYKGYELHQRNELALKDKDIISQLIEINKVEAQQIQKALDMHDENMEQIAKSASGAKSLTYGTRTLTEKDLADIRQPAAREPAQVSTFTEEFLVFQINNKDLGLIKIQAQNLRTKEEITISVEEDLFQDESDVEVLWDAVKDHIPVKLQVTSSTKKSGTKYRLESIATK
ncbi:hypothetical protein [Parasutterella secunda]|uniref:Uncharacterized protein n=1 Tax=Parasutterella secunda TaxID=626947 RepID=A0ABS2GQW2_9BURK|nr:hypothetical protein [Parasutterella secunda]MBM6928163.1 hypothetical protein [Parasutterella secunda]